MTKKRDKKKTPIADSEQVYGARFMESLLYFLVVGWLPFLFVCLLQLRQSRGQTLLFVLLILSLGLSCWLGREEKRVFQGEISYLSGLLFFGCLLMTLLIVWNYSFRLYTSEVDFTRDIFRSKFRNPRAPLYGYLFVPEMKQFFYPLLSCGLFLTYMLRNRKETVEGWGIPTSAFFLLLLSISLALKDHVSRVVDWMASYGGFTQGLTLFSTIPDLLRNYTSNMGQLGGHANHYPPGIFMIMKAEQLLDMKALTRFVVMSSGVGTIYVVRRIATLLGLSGFRRATCCFALHSITRSSEFHYRRPSLHRFVSREPDALLLLKRIDHRQTIFCHCHGPILLTLHFFLLLFGIHRAAHGHPFSHCMAMGNVEAGRRTPANSPEYSHFCRLLCSSLPFDGFSADRLPEGSHTQ